MPYFTSDGHRIHYREAGSGPLMLLLPGNTASSVSHQDALEHFGRRFHAVAPDFLGTGLSDRLREWPDDWWAQGARDSAALAAHLGYRRAVVAGTSGGGIATLLVAIHFPELVELAIADSCPRLDSPEQLRSEVAFRNRRSENQIAFWRNAQGEDWEQVVDADNRLLLRTAEKGLDPFQGRLSSIRCPLLLTGSFRDRSIPDLDAQLCSIAREVPGSQLFMIDEGAHPLMWSAPKPYYRIADLFLNSHLTIISE
jgi:valacyclovir hydrolase